jgi:hypothetical protein
MQKISEKVNLLRKRQVKMQDFKSKNSFLHFEVAEILQNAIKNERNTANAVETEENEAA